MGNDCWNELSSDDNLPGGTCGSPLFNRPVTALPISFAKPSMRIHQTLSSHCVSILYDYIMCVSHFYFLYFCMISLLSALSNSSCCKCGKLNYRAITRMRCWSQCCATLFCWHLLFWQQQSAICLFYCHCCVDSITGLSYVIHVCLFFQHANTCRAVTFRRPQ